MTATSARTSIGGMDPTTVAGLFGLLAGVLSVPIPYFSGLTAALSALLAATVVVRWARSGRPSIHLRSSLPAIAVVVVGWTVFLGGPALLSPVRGLVLGASGLPLVWSGGSHAWRTPGR